METALRHTHLFAVIIFLLIYLVKTFLLLSNKTEPLAKFTKIVKVPEMIVSFLFLATGIYMLTQVGATKFIIIKIAMVLVSIPLAIIGFKKSNKVLASLAMLLIIGAYGLAEVNKKRVAKQSIDPSVSDTNAPGYDIIGHGEKLYAAYCERCHGKDAQGGAMGLNLTITTLDYNAKIERVKNGMGSMAGFKDVLTEQEISAVVTYVESLKK